MIREAGPSDAAALEAFLARHAASSMFLRGNLEAHGTQERMHPHGTTFWIVAGSQGIKAVAGRTNRGYLMCQAPGQGAAFWAAVNMQMAGRKIAGITGAPDQTGAWIDALGLAKAQFVLNDITPLFEAAPGDLTPARGALTLRLPTGADAAFLCDWFKGFFRETGLGLPQGRSLKDAAQDFVAKPDARIMLAGEVPVAMTAINARAVDAVQVGGVFVPPEHRGKGFGGAVVALHMAQLARTGIRRAVLFAASRYAAAAYGRIGFREVGGYRVAMLRSPVVVGARRDA